MLPFMCTADNERVGPLGRGGKGGGIPGELTSCCVAC